MKKVLTISSMLLGVVFLAGCGQQPVSQTQSTAPVSVKKQSEVAIADLQTYKNQQLGFEFSYPAKLGNLNIEILPENIQGSFSNSQNISLGGITKEYTSPRGGFYMDFREFKKEGSDYFWGFVGNDYFSITPQKVINQDIILVDCMSFEDKCKPTGPSISIPEGKIAGLINLKNTKFKGLILLVDKNTPEEAMLVNILSTFKFTN